MVRAHGIHRAWRIFLLVVSGLAATPALAALQAYVDRNPVSASESFTLTLESSDDLDGTPDLSALQQDFDVLSQSKSTSIQIVNGSTSRTNQWVIGLMPKRSGQLQIPSITVGSERSAPLDLTVTDAPTPAATADAAQQGDLFLEVSATPHSVYVQQQVVYKVRLFHTLDVGNGATLSEPKLAGDDAIVEKLGDDKSYQTSRNGVRYAVVERDYAIYPQRSGRIEIPPLVFDGDVVQPGGNGLFNFDPFNANTRHRRVVSAAVTITAQAAPAAFHGNQWLPARNLQLVEQWSPSPPHFSVGQPVTRTVAVMADGLSAAQLPPLAGATVDGLKQYSDQPTLKDTKADNGITGIRTEKIALIPMHPGSVTLPAIAIPWWNTATDTLEVARLPARTVTVAAGATPAPAPAQPVPAALPMPISRPGAPSTVGALPPPPSVSPGAWPWLALALGAGWLGTLLAWWWRAHRRTHTAAPATERDESLSQLERQVKEACLRNDPETSSRALLAWARRRWPEQPPVSLTALAQRCAPPLAEALRALDRARYAAGATPWHGTPLWQAFSRHRPQETTSSAAADTALRPLWT